MGSRFSRRRFASLSYSVIGRRLIVLNNEIDKAHFSYSCGQSSRSYSNHSFRPTYFSSAQRTNTARTQKKRFWMRMTSDFVDNRQFKLGFDTNQTTNLTPAATSGMLSAISANCRREANRFYLKLQVVVAFHLATSVPAALASHHNHIFRKLSSHSCSVPYPGGTS